MGSRVSQIVADIYMEDFESKVLALAPHPPKLWLRYMDGTFTVLHENNVEEFTDHLIFLDDHIKFTREPESDGKLPFLDVCVHVHPDATTSTTVYRKSTHTDQYLNFSSNHPLDHKRSVVRTLIHRAENIVSHKKQKKIELCHVKQALSTNGYPKWAFHTKRKPQKPPANTWRRHLPPVGLPYMKGVSEKLKRIFHKFGANIYHVPTNTIRSSLVKPKDPAKTIEQCGVIYQLNCKDCGESYIGETARVLKKRVSEHKRTEGGKRTAVGDHQAEKKHQIDWDNLKIVGREDHTWKRKIKEALLIQRHTPHINKDQGAEIPPIYTRLLSHGRLRPRDNI